METDYQVLVSFVHIVIYPLLHIIMILCHKGFRAIILKYNNNNLWLIKFILNIYWLFKKVIATSITKIIVHRNHKSFVSTQIFYKYFFSLLDYLCDSM